MKFLERRVQEVYAGKEAEYAAWEKAWAELEARVGGFPEKQYYQVMAGPSRLGVFVWERQWESFAACEAAYERMWQEETPSADWAQIIKSEHMEFYTPWEP